MIRFVALFAILAGIGVGTYFWITRMRPHAPQRFLIYIDRTPSTQKAGIGKARWLDAGDRIVQILREAPPASEVEVWTTTRVAGMPTMLGHFRVYRRLREQRKEIDKVPIALDAWYEKAREDADSLPYSPIFEDVFFLLKRGEQMKSPFDIIACTDLEQYSRGLTLSQILRAGDDGKSLLKKALDKMPAPKLLPRKIEFVWYPGGDALSGSERGKLERFVLNLSSGWGKGCEFTQPIHLDTAEAVPPTRR